MKEKAFTPSSPYVGTIIRLFGCIGIAGIALFSYIDKLNELTELRLAIPQLAKEVNLLQEENARMLYEIERFESPVRLMELKRMPEYSHLKYPYLDEEILLPKGKPISGKDAGAS